MYAFIDRPADRFARACDFWTAVTGTELSAPRGEHEEFVTLLPADGACDACVKAQAVGDGGGVHLDLSVPDTAALVDRATGLGATVVDHQPTHTVLRSPGGMTLCAVPWHGESTRPGVHDGPRGGATRLDQVCVDLAPARYEAEVEFWVGLTGWESLQGSRSEFHVIRPPATMPIRLLLQRLDTPRPTGAHLDLACRDVAATRAWHEELGASHVADGARWTVMRDPTGATYCLTGRDPATGSLPASG